MTTDSLQPRMMQGNWSGFPTLFVRESRKWWQTRRWWTQAILWLVILTGFAGFGLFVLPGSIDQANAAAQAAGATDEVELTGEQFRQDVLPTLFGMAGFLLPIGVIVLAQNQVFGEKVSGVAAWILSKPVSRSAYLLAKLVADWFGILLVMVLLPLIPALLLLSAAGIDISLIGILVAVGLLLVLLIFYHSLTFMMSVIGSSSEVILGVSLSVLIGGMVLRDPLAAIFGDLILLTPWLLPNVIIVAATGQPLPHAFLVNAVSVIVLTVVCLGVAFWRFRRQEL